MGYDTNLNLYPISINYNDCVEKISVAYSDIDKQARKGGSLTRVKRASPYVMNQLPLFGCLLGYTKQDRNYFRKFNLRLFQKHRALPVEMCEK